MGKLGKAFLFLIAVMLVLTAVSRAAASFTVAQVQVEQPQARKIIHTVTGSGQVEKMGETPIFVVEGVLVAEVKVRQGQTVKKGDVLARLDMDSIQEKIESLEDEIQVLRLQNQALAAHEQKDEEDRSRAEERAREDYDAVVSQSEEQKREAEEKAGEAEDKLEEIRQETYIRIEEELTDAVKAAEQSYNLVKEQAEETILQAKRAVENARSTPAVTYDTEILQIEITQKQRRLDELYQKQRKVQGEMESQGEEILSLKEEMKSLEEEILSLDEEITILKLQMQEKVNAADKQEEERKRALLRAQEDYDATVKKQERLVGEALEIWSTAKQALEAFLEDSGKQISEDASVKAAEEALQKARQQVQDSELRQKEQLQQAQRNLEDSMVKGASNETAAINQITIAERQRQLNVLGAERDSGGRVKAQMDGTVTQVQLLTGQKTLETAAFLMSDTSGGMSFVTQIGKEEAVHVMAGDLVTLSANGKNYEELSVVSVQPGENEGAEVTVFVPKDTLSLGEYAFMELTKQSKEYGITLPISALHSENGKYFVYVMEQEDTVLGGQYSARRLDVTVAEQNGLYAAVSDSSLTGESNVIVSSDQMLAVGERVRLQEGT